MIRNFNDQCSRICLNTDITDEVYLYEIVKYNKDVEHNMMRLLYYNSRDNVKGQWTPGPVDIKTARAVAS